MTLSDGLKFKLVMSEHILYYLFLDVSRSVHDYANLKISQNVILRCLRIMWLDWSRVLELRKEKNIHNAE